MNFKPLRPLLKIWKSPMWGQKSKLSKVCGVTYQNLCEKGRKPMKKDSAQSGLPVSRKSSKATRKRSFLRIWYLRVVLGLFFQNWYAWLSWILFHWQWHPKCHPYNHEMCHHWLTPRKMKGWPVSDETKLSNDFKLCAAFLKFPQFRFPDCCRNLSILLHLDHLLWTFFCNFGLFAAILKRRGNRCWSSSHYYLPLVAVAPPLQEGLPPSPSSMATIILIIIIIINHHNYKKFPQSPRPFLFSMINHPNQKATAWKKILMVLPLAHHPNQTLGLDQVSLAI